MDATLDPAGHKPGSGTAASAPDSGSTEPTVVRTSTPEAVPSPEASTKTADLIPKASVELLQDARIDTVVESEVGFDPLLKRLKASINSCEEFAKFVKRKAAQESAHYSQLKKDAKITKESYAAKVASNEVRTDSFRTQLDQLLAFDERLYDVGLSYVKGLQTMSSELTSLASTVAKRRKSLKEEGRKREKEYADALTAAERAKAKYEGLCGDLERLHNGDPNKKSLTLRGTRTGEQQEEDLRRKIEHADAEYSSKVQHCNRVIQALIDRHRPATGRALRDLILEIDTALSLQIQKYATWSETVLVQAGTVLASPFRSNKKHTSMREVACGIDNEKDLFDYLIKYKNQVALRTRTVEYRRHPSQEPVNSSASSKNAAVRGAVAGPRNSANVGRRASVISRSAGYAAGVASVGAVGAVGTVGAAGAAGTAGAAGIGHNAAASGSSVGTASAGLGTTQQQSQAPTQFAAAPGGVRRSMVDEVLAQPDLSVANSAATPPYSAVGVPGGVPGGIEDGTAGTAVVPHLPIFGTAIDRMAEAEGEVVPKFVRQAIDVLDRYGLHVNGLYRVNGSSVKLLELRRAMDEDFDANVELLLPKNGDDLNHIHCIASLLKQYFKALPEHLLTNALGPRFIQAARNPDMDERLKEIHETVFELPDANYWTLRTLIFHLCRVAAEQEYNYMSSYNLGVVWGPTLMPDAAIQSPSDMTWASKVVEEIMYFASSIFDTE